MVVTILEKTKAFEKISKVDDHVKNYVSILETVVYVSSVVHVKVGMLENKLVIYDMS